MERYMLGVFLLFVAGLVRADVKDELRSQLEDCKNQFNVTEEEVKKITEKEPPTSEDAKCYLHCIFSRMDLMTEEGQMNPEGMKAFVREIPEMKESDRQKLDQVADKCAKAPLGDDPCENAVLIYSCVNTEADEMGVKAP